MIGKVTLQSENTRSQKSNNGEISFKISVNGKWDGITTKKVENVFEIHEGGLIKNQKYTDKKYLEQAYSTGWDFKTNHFSDGSKVVKAIQKKVGADNTGFFDQITIKKLQKFLDVPINGILDQKTVEAFQHWLNQQ